MLNKIRSMLLKDNVSSFLSTKVDHIEIFFTNANLIKGNDGWIPHKVLIGSKYSFNRVKIFASLYFIGQDNIWCNKLNL